MGVPPPLPPVSQSLAARYDSLDLSGFKPTAPRGSAADGPLEWLFEFRLLAFLFFFPSFLKAIPTQVGIHLKDHLL